MVVSCGDSHTTTHGAFGALAFGTGTSDTEHVLATQTIRKKKSKTLQLVVNGPLPENTYAKDLALHILRKVPPSEAAGYVVEYSGSVIDKLSMEERMTLCNMSTELNCDAALVPPDDTTFEYLRNRTYAPSNKYFEAALNYWRSLRPDAGCKYDKTIEIDVSNLTSTVSWGTNLMQSIGIDESIPYESSWDTNIEQITCRDALKYMGLSSGAKLSSVEINNVFIGSCTNG